MIIQSISALYVRDLQKLKIEIELYQFEEKMWVINQSILNSGGNLCLHIIGNIKTFIGNGLCQNGYVRQRELEFSKKNVSKADLFKEIEETIQIVKNGLSELTISQLDKPFPLKIGEDKTSVIHTLLHLHAHLNYHLGQINYHRRLLDFK